MTLEPQGVQVLELAAVGTSEKASTSVLTARADTPTVVKPSNRRSINQVTIIMRKKRSKAPRGGLLIFVLDSKQRPPTI